MLLLIDYRERKFSLFNFLFFPDAQFEKLKKKNKKNNLERNTEKE